MGKSKGKFVIVKGKTCYRHIDGSLYDEKNIEEMMENIKKFTEAISNFQFYFD